MNFKIPHNVPVPWSRRAEEERVQKKSSVAEITKKTRAFIKSLLADFEDRTVIYTAGNTIQTMRAELNKDRAKADRF